jgi:hypothetical protein
MTLKPSTIGDNVYNMANLVKQVAKDTRLDPMLVFKILELNVAYLSREAMTIVEPEEETPDAE